MPTYRDTYRYHFKMGNKIVHTGITNNIYRRAVEHKREPGHGKGHIKQIGFRTTYPIARAWRDEQEKLGKPVFK